MEIGPGLGLAAERFLELFPHTPYHVIEPHHWFADYVRQRLGHRVVLHTQEAKRSLPDAIRDASEAGQRPILLYMDNVLEHVFLPRDLMAALKAQLPRGSVALIDVPNEHGLKWRHRIYTTIGGQSTVAAGHINLFTIRAFHTMLDGLGLRHHVHQRGIRQPEEVNCLPEGKVLDFALLVLRVLPIDTMLQLGNNLRVKVEF